MHGHMVAVAEVVEGTLEVEADILAVDTLADTAVTLVAAGGTRVVAIMVAGVADGVTAIPVAIGGDLDSIGDGNGRLILPTIGEDPIPILIHIMIMQPLQRPCRTLLSTPTKDKSNLITGISVGTHRVITPTSKIVRAAGCR